MLLAYATYNNSSLSPIQVSQKVAHDLYSSQSDDIIYTVSQKNIPDIFDCNLKTNYQSLVIFGKNSPHTTCHQLTI